MKQLRSTKDAISNVGVNTSKDGSSVTSSEEKFIMLALVH